ncbi:MAG: hypothetical protein RRB22_15440 [Gammaproteobacteria bacterium]|nr:hypothetical protein [Gammaproteobacteria bacterium]
MPTAGEGMPPGFFVFGPIMWVVIAIIVIIPFWAIFSKAGYSKWLSLLMVIPIVNLIALYFLAFSAWPCLQRRD